MDAYCPAIAYLATLRNWASLTAFAVAAEAVLGIGTEDIDTAGSLFSLGLISLVTTLHDRWTPLHALRLRDVQHDEASATTP